MAGQPALRAEAGDAVAQRIEHRQRLAAQRRRERRGRQAEDRAGRQQVRHAAARFLAHQAGPGAARPAGIIEPITSALRDREGEARIALVEPVLEGVARPRPAAGVRCARAQTERPCGAMISSRLCADQRGQPLHHRLQRRRRRRRRRSRRRRRRRSAWSASASGIASPSITAETLAKVAASRANQPVVSEVGACGSMPVDVDAGRASGGCRRGRRSSPARAPSRRCRCRARCRRGRRRPPPPSPTTSRPARGPARATLTGVPSKAFSPRMPSETSSVMVLPISVAPASSSVCTAQACLRRAPAGRSASRGCRRRSATPATSNRSLAAKVRPAQRPAGAALDAHPRARHEGADIVGHAVNFPDGDGYSAGAAGARPLTRQRLAQPGLNRMPVSLSNQM